jgi:hypothetical protein
MIPDSRGATTFGFTTAGRAAGVCVATRGAAMCAAPTCGKRTPFGSRRPVRGGAIESASARVSSAFESVGPSSS